MPERSVLHVLPHPGGGGETYVDTLEAMEGYRFERLYLGPTARPSGSLVGGVARAIRQARRHDVVHVHGEVAAGLCVPVLATRPSVVTLHGLNLLRRSDGTKRRVATLNLRLIVRTAAQTICVSDAEQRELILAVGVRASERTFVVRNGVEPVPPPTSEERAAARRELGLEDGTPVAIWVGPLQPHKDPLTAVRAAREAGLTMLVVGEGALRDEVERIGQRSVRCLGERRDMRRLLAAADLFVLSSRSEGLSFSLLEAMSAGLAPIVTDHPANLEAIGDAGLAVPYGDQRALAAVLSRLAHNAAERRSLGERGTRRTTELFRADQMVNRTREIYGHVLRERLGR